MKSNLCKGYHLTSDFDEKEKRQDCRQVDLAVKKERKWAYWADPCELAQATRTLYAAESGILDLRMLCTQHVTILFSIVLASGPPKAPDATHQN